VIGRMRLFGLVMLEMVTLRDTLALGRRGSTFARGRLDFIRIKLLDPMGSLPADFHPIRIGGLLFSLNERVFGRTRLRRLYTFERALPVDVLAGE